MSNCNNAKTIMVQGTASDVGKSLINTALCRIFASNKKVAPFKSWNMSLNAYVTAEGREVGIAQAIQAQAAKTKITADMQPILVKPSGQGQTQIVVKGQVSDDLIYNKKNEEKKYIKKARKIIKSSLNNLKEKFEIIVMEGAGSPVEMNRKDKDLANMSVARINNTPVILVADIDRGGALASLVGTLKLLPPAERKLVKGLIINRFRGDYELLKSGIEFLEEYTGKPVLGVIPYLKNIQLPEEDGASLDKNIKNNADNERKINIGVIKLPKISNFTDFKSLSREENVNLWYIDHRQKLQNKNFDLLIIPGSKNPAADLLFLQKTGLAPEIKKMVKKEDLPVLGICGGYQIMGQKILDPGQKEGDIREMEGLGIFPIKTYFSSEKVTHQIKAEINKETSLFSKSNKKIKGYEIHRGKSELLTSSPTRDYPFIIKKRSGQKVNIRDGIINEKGNCIGTYIHGLFENDHFRHSLLNNLRQKKGLPLINNENNFRYDKRLEADFEELAQIVENNLDMELLYEILE